jgi:hypothetical protein
MSHVPSRADNGHASQATPEGTLVRLLRALEPSELQPGLVDRCWQEFRLLADLPEPPAPQPAPPATPASAPVRRPADLAPPPQDDLRERLGFARPRRIVSARP